MARQGRVGKGLGILNALGAAHGFHRTLIHLHFTELMIVERVAALGWSGH